MRHLREAIKRGYGLLETADDAEFSRRVEGALRRIDEAGVTRGRLGIAHALAEAGHTPPDETHLTRKRVS